MTIAVQTPPICHYFPPFLHFHSGTTVPDLDCSKDHSNLMVNPVRLQLSHTVPDRGQTVGTLRYSINDAGSTWSDCPLANTLLFVQRGLIVFISTFLSQLFFFLLRILLLLLFLMPLEKSVTGIRHRVDGSSCETTLKYLTSCL